MIGEQEQFKPLALAGILFAEFDMYYGYDKYKDEPKKFPLVTAYVKKRSVEEYFNKVLADEDKELFAKYFHLQLVNFIKLLKQHNLIDELHPEYDMYKEYLKEVRSDKYWKASKLIEFNNAVFKTDLNEEFFKHTVDYYKLKNNLNQKTFHFLYYILKDSSMLNKQKDYVEYVNKYYNQTINRIQSTDNLTKNFNAQELRLSILNEALKEFNKIHTKVELNIRKMLV